MPYRINLEPYVGQWVALHPKSLRVIGHDKSLAIVEQQALQQGIKHPIYYPVPESDAPFVSLG